ncbi:MAG: pantoate--beta-alanine ligase [Myxococcota bacterium]|nr:pantoate--beta-alanine ligase [Myxococcota bacterium]
MPELLRDAAAMRAWRDARKNERVALVPTMGYLHDGHLGLVKRARELADLVVASIFVNPTQFGPNEDFSRYPRDEAGDLAKLASAGVDAVFLPSREELYPTGFDTYVVPEELARGLCGASRPGHFRGVCTVVCLLFRITKCDVAVFGEKDYQQLTIIRRMTRDLWLDVDIVGHSIVREADGLAMSSRNVYLSTEERARALSLSRTLFAMREEAVNEKTVAALLANGRALLGEVKVDYLEIVGAEDLRVLTRLDRPARALVAAFVGKTRLIDNVAI